MPRSPRFEVFEMGCLRIDKQSGRNRKGRPFCRFRQTGKTKRTANPDGAPQNARGKIGETRQLARAPGQHHASARLTRSPSAVKR